jgi:hypothetical protein
MERASLEILEEFAINTGRNIEKFDSYKLYPFGKIPKSTKWIKIEENNSFYIAYDNSSNSVSPLSLISGVAVPITLNKKQLSLKIAQKDILDKLNPFKKYVNSSDKEIDKNLAIYTTDVNNINQIFIDEELKKLTIKTFKTIPALRLEIINLNLKNIPFINGEDYLFLYKTTMDTTIPALRLEIINLNLKNIPFINGEDYLFLYKQQWILQSQTIEKLYQTTNLFYKKLVNLGYCQ